MAKLRPRARIVRTIGDQLISGPEAALIELVKNAYDADASEVYISIDPRREGPEPTTGEIVVSDRGHGMTAEDLVGRWFEPATTDKLERRTSPKGRVMLGAKGVGRFATARLGTKLVLTCAAKDSDGALEVSKVTVNWSEFEEKKYLDEININVQTRAGQPGEPTGVHLQISDLRDKWTQAQLEQLVRELRRLVSPLEAQENGFRIYLDLSAFKSEVDGFEGRSLVAGALAALEDADSEEDDWRQVKPFRLDSVYHYQVRGEFAADGSFTGTFTNQRSGGQSSPVSIEASETKDTEAGCGKVKVALNVYDREGEAVEELFETLGLGAVGRRDARRILDENIGIGIYRSGFRIRPYGDAETDWLELERKRVQDPSRKLGLNQLWGMVEIQTEKVSGLVERSSREGLEHNGSFARLKRLISDLMAHVEQLRYDFRQKAGLSRKTTGSTEEVHASARLAATQRAVAGLPPRYRDKVERALKQDTTALKTSVAELETRQQALASRAALGLVVAQLLHDGRRFVGDIATHSRLLVDGAPRLMEQSGFGEHFRKTFPQSAQSIQASATNLNKLFKALDPVSGRRRGRPQALAVKPIIEQCVALFKDAIGDAGVIVELKAGADLPKFMGYEADLMAALLNIIDNAVYWLATSPNRPRRLSLECAHSKKYVRLSVSNNGPVIGEKFIHRLFSPGFTLKPEGSGIGLAIAREAMRASKGDVAFDVDAEQTTFVIEMVRAVEDR